MELKDGSEQIRIKKEMAEKLRREAEDLDMSVPETLYFMMHVYFHIYKKKKVLVDADDLPQPSRSKKKDTRSFEIDENEYDESDDSDDMYSLSLGD